MAEQLTFTPVYLNQFRNRTIANIDTTSFTQAVNQIANSFEANTQLLGQVSQSLTTQSIQIEELSSTANALNPNKIFVNKETPSGLIDGLNTTYILENIPTAGSEHLYLNGLLIDSRAFTDYTITGSVITFNEPLQIN